MSVMLVYVTVNRAESIHYLSNHPLAIPAPREHSSKTSESKVRRPIIYISPHWEITTSVAGFSPRVRVFSTLRTTSIPSTTFPNTTCLLFRKGVGTVVTKNWQPLVLGPEF